MTITNANPTPDTSKLPSPAAAACAVAYHWKDLIFDLASLDERQSFQEIAQLAGSEPSAPVTHENNPILHARLCDALLSTQGFEPFAFDDSTWTPYVRDVPAAISAVDFGTLDDVASAFEQMEKQAERRRKLNASTATPAKKVPRTAAQQPRAKSGKFGSKR